jgi:signal peptidase I
MLQVVDDTNYWSQTLVSAGWPSRWQNWSASGGSQAVWKAEFEPQDQVRASQKFSVQGAAGRDAWLRYHHLAPSREDWEHILSGEKLPNNAQLPGTLIRDFYAYNTGELYWRMGQETGFHWVGDIALEGELDVKSDQGEVLLDLVEAGVHYQCRIDVKTGVATLTIDNGQKQFSQDDGSGAVDKVVSQEPTPLQGAGAYEVRFSNADNQLTLWIDDKPIAFNGPTTFLSSDDPRPHYTDQDPLDLAPAGIGVNGAAVDVSRLRILRDVYYLALEKGGFANHDYNVNLTDEAIQTVLDSPDQWSTTDLFSKRRESRDYVMDPNQFFPLGDNSPQSKDARIWEPEPHVDRELLTGKALFIYWPHHWRRPVPFLPNFARMGFIR